MKALILAHPGHELRVHGWMAAHRPVTFVLTNGSGATGIARIASTESVLRDAGAEKGGVFAPLSDARAYEALLAGEVAVFLDIARALTAEILDRGVTVVAGDAWEGYNPMHDVCRLLIDASVTAASPSIENWSFPLAASPDAVDASADVYRFALDDAAFQRKLDAANRYPELASEVEAAMREFGAEAFRTEVFTRVTVPHWEDRRFANVKPFYETHGEARVNAGKYGAVIRYRDHVQPIADALKELVQSPAHPADQQHASPSRR